MKDQIYRNHLAIHLRNLADQDYIAARSIWRLQLDKAFLWSSLHAIEKYLKATLLFFGKPVRQYQHKIGELYDATEDLPDLVFDCPPPVEHFVSSLGRIGDDRYHIKHTIVEGDELPRLDEAVWHIRRYAYQYLTFKSEGYPPEAYEKMIANANSKRFTQQPWKFSFPGGRGFLEEVLAREKVDPTRKALIWKNRFYNRHARSSALGRWSWTAPPHANFPLDIKNKMNAYIKLE